MLKDKIEKTKIENKDELIKLYLKYGLDCSGDEDGIFSGHIEGKYISMDLNIPYKKAEKELKEYIGY